MKTRVRISIIVIFFVLFTALPGSAILSAKAESTKVDIIIGFTSKPDIELVKKNGGEVENTYTIINAVHALMPQTTVGALESNGEIAYIHENGKVQALTQTIPWGILRVNATVAWPLSRGTGVKVAVLDTGIGPHPDLVVYGGYNFVSNNGNYGDDFGHGTHVAGTIAALDNTIGVVGVAPEAKIYAVKMLNSAGSGTIDQAVSAIQWSVTNGMKILSMSWGTTTDFQALHDAVNAAYASGLLLIAAAGNTGNSAGTGDSVNYPAKYDTVIAVAALDQNNVRASFSSTGPKVEISAPGVNVNSTYLNNGYTTMMGTSMATPHVSGVAALVWARNPSLTNAQVRQILQNTAIDLWTPGRDNRTGYGLVNAYAAVSAAGQYYVGGSEFRSSPAEGLSTFFAIIAIALTVVLGQRLIKTS